MKLLLDQNLSYKLCPKLEDIYPGSSHVRLVNLSEALDKAVWDFAKANGFVLVTQDVDFAEMAALLGPPPKVIWLRCGNQPSAAIELLLRIHHDSLELFYADETGACREIY